ncbi:MAG: hypothetical protein Kow0074_15050 [Candidatus Zixiibacteriota bacterium]
MAEIRSVRLYQTQSNCNGESRSPRKSLPIALLVKEWRTPIVSPEFMNVVIE